jgi:hypothetical protein
VVRCELQVASGSADPSRESEEPGARLMRIYEVRRVLKSWSPISRPPAATSLEWRGARCSTRHSRSLWRPGPAKPVDGKEAVVASTRCSTPRRLLRASRRPGNDQYRLIIRRLVERGIGQRPTDQPI